MYQLFYLWGRSQIRKKSNQYGCGKSSTSSRCIDPDASKERGFGLVAYHVKGDPRDTAAIKAGTIQPICFLSKVLSSAEKNYWPTELELACLVWGIRRLSPIVRSAQAGVIVFTDHSAIVGIGRASTLTSTNVERSNPRIIRAAQYLSMFDLDIRHWPGRLHILADALSRLPANNQPNSQDLSTDVLEDVFEYSALSYSLTVVDLEEAFKERIKQGIVHDKRLSALLFHTKRSFMGTPKTDASKNGRCGCECGKSSTPLWYSPLQLEEVFDGKVKTLTSYWCYVGMGVRGSNVLLFSTFTQIFT